MSLNGVDSETEIMKLKIDLKPLYNWLLANKILLNSKKTEMYFKNQA